VRITLGRLEEQEGNLPAAEEAYRSAVADGDTPESNFALAQFLQRASRIPEAELVLRRLDKRNPDQPSRLADFEMMAGRPLNAVERYTRELTNPEGKSDRETAAAIASRLVEADLSGAEKGVMSPAERARIHLDQYRGRLDAATLGILQAEIALAEGNLAKAQEQAAAAVATAPDSAAAHYVLGTAKYCGGDKSGARNEWQLALEADGSFVPARIAAGRLDLETGDTEEADRHFAAALRQEPANFEALILYARALASRKQFLPALQIARRAIAVDASSPVPNLVIGDIYLQQQRPGQALVYFEKAVLLDPDNHEAVDGLIRVYRAGTVTRAMVRHIEDIAAHEPRSATLYEWDGCMRTTAGTAIPSGRTRQLCRSSLRERRPPPTSRKFWRRPELPMPPPRSRNAWVGRPPTC
jgi:tetratricopeptide (TPR) repeat protein